ncbi:MAG: agmatinase [Acholeplasmatales bacterium]|jgi:agmatinase|nr:agmatinase [Acholeplasmatales bacterium]
MRFKKVDLSFQSCNSEYNAADVVIFSAPMDTTTSFRPGTRFAGNAVRVDSIGIEWYSPYRNLSLKDFKTCDIGDLDFGVGNIKLQLSEIFNTTKRILKDNKTPIMIGGEHLASYSTIKAVYEKYPDLRVIHFDAHTDLRESFLGNTYSHATFMRHVNEFLGDHKIYQFGIRSGDKEEFDWAKDHIYQHKYDLETLDSVVEEIKNFPVYITIDLDVLDPAVFPGTGTPEPGGITYKELLKAFDLFEKLTNIVGSDLMELSPYLDASGASNMAAIKALREMILLIQKNKSNK